MGYFLFKILYKREAIWSKKLPHTVYDCDKIYHEAVYNHIIKMMEIQKVAMKKNYEYQQNIKTEF